MHGTPGRAFDILYAKANLQHVESVYRLVGVCTHREAETRRLGEIEARVAEVAR